jgi:thiol-disulfide isomerase/thioredoxin
VHTEHDDFDDVVGRGAIPIIHDQDITLTEARIALDVGLTERFAAGLVLPLRMIVTRIHYLDGSGMPVELVEPSTHHRNETLTGIADPMVLGALQVGALTLRAGLTLPLGKTERDPFAMPDLPHEHIQFGTGTFNPVLAIEGAHAWGPWAVSGFAFTQQVVYANSKGYHAGDRYAAGVALRRALGAWSVRGGVEMQAETYERWNGVRHDDEGNQGRIDAMVGLGASWAASESVTLDAGIKIPFVTHVVGGQLDMPALVELGATYTFGAREHDHHDHDHEHGDEHEHDEHAAEPLDTTGADIADLGHAGSRVELIPVPGKITVFDFWAPWCQPCKALEPVLVELAKANPDGVAVRRIDVVDWDSPVVAQYLTPRGFDLPHVKIYDATGALVFEESSGPGKLAGMMERIRTIVGGPAATAPGPLSTSVDIQVTERGFQPAIVDVPHGVPVTLRFTRTSDSTCATALVLTHDGNKLTRELPLGQQVELTLTFDTPGPVPYACPMDMIGGTINVH